MSDTPTNPYQHSGTDVPNGYPGAPAPQPGTHVQPADHAYPGYAEAAPVYQEASYQGEASYASTIEQAAYQGEANAYQQAAPDAYTQQQAWQGDPSAAQAQRYPTPAEYSPLPSDMPMGNPVTPTDLGSQVRLGLHIAAALLGVVGALMLATSSNAPEVLWTIIGISGALLQASGAMTGKKASGYVAIAGTAIFGLYWLLIGMGYVRTNGGALLTLGFAAAVGALVMNPMVRSKTD